MTSDEVLRRLASLTPSQRRVAELLVRFPWVHERDLPLVAPFPITYAALAKHRKALFARFETEHRLHFFFLVHGFLLPDHAKEFCSSIEHVSQ